MHITSMTKMSNEGNNIYDIIGKQDYRGIITSHGNLTVSIPIWRIQILQCCHSCHTPLGSILLHVHKCCLRLHVHSTVQYHKDKCHSKLLNISTSMFKRHNNIIMCDAYSISTSRWTVKRQHYIVLN